MPQSSIYSNLAKTKYLFIDGACLNTILETLSKKLFGGIELELNYAELARGFQKVFYYDCLPVKKPGEDEESYKSKRQIKNNLFNKLKSINGFHVYEGTARLRDKKKTQEQKEIDIMIAVDMLTHSFHKNMDEATLLAGDLDFKPLIDALVLNGMYVSLWYPKGETNYELVDAADSRMPITAPQVYTWLAESCKSKVKIPDSRRSSAHPSNAQWQQLEGMEIQCDKVEIYEITGQGKYFAVLREGNEYPYYVHDNLEQLKFYVKNLHGSHVYRGD
ncbi:MAG: NYN domain-containing protein [Trichormus sp.]